MIRLLLRALFVTVPCGSMAVLSTKWSKPEGRQSLNKTSSNNQGKILDEVSRLEDVDVWGKQHGCSFIFVKDWDKKEIYTAMGYADAKGGRAKKVNTWSGQKTWEKAILEAINKNKIYCVEKLKTFTFLWSPIDSKFYIGNPNEKPSVKFPLEIGL